MIRDLDPRSDLAAVQDLYLRASDYVRLETGLDPGPDAAREFFGGAPPGAAPEDGLKLGAWEGARLVGICDLGFGYPEAGDAYVGLLLLAPEARMRGLGRAAMAEVEARARARGASRLLIAVLEENRGGLAFWRRLGFAEERRFPPERIGERMHARLRMTKALEDPANDLGVAGA